MPALANPRWERFALALFAGLDGKTRIERAQSTAYLAAYPNCKPGNSAESAASQLLRRIKPITERVRELQAEQSAKIQKKIDLSRERVGRRLDLASQMAERQENPNGIATAELGIARVFHSIRDTDDTNNVDYNTAKSMTDIGRKLLQSVGFREPDDVSIQAAIEANDAFIQRLEAIRDAAQGLTVEQDEE
jgi:valyl-tRNA synthetase